MSIKNKPPKLFSLSDLDQIDVNDLDEEDFLEAQKAIQEVFDQKYITDRLMTPDELPIDAFDLSNTFRLELSDYGQPNTFDNIGKYVRFIGTSYIPLGNNIQFDMFNKVGLIALNANNRIVMALEVGFFGWVHPKDYEIIEVLEQRGTFNYIN